MVDALSVRIRDVFTSTQLPMLCYYSSVCSKPVCGGCFYFSLRLCNWIIEIGLVASISCLQGGHVGWSGEDLMRASPWGRWIQERGDEWIRPPPGPLDSRWGVLMCGGGGASPGPPSYNFFQDRYTRFGKEAEIAYRNKQDACLGGARIIRLTTHTTVHEWLF